MFFIEVIGLNKIITRIDGLISRLSNLGPAFQRIDKDFRITEQRLFDSEGGTGASGTWDGWSDDYEEWRSANFPHAPIQRMFLDGGLQSSLVGGGGYVFRPGTQQAEYGTDLQTESGWGLGFVHFEGFDVPTPYGNPGASAKKVPARKAIDPTQEDIDRWTKMIADHIWGRKA